MADDLDLDSGTTEPADTDATVDAPDGGATPEPPAPTPAKTEQHFIDPSQLPEEIKPHWKRMHGAYNKKLSEIDAERTAHKADLELLARFRSDPSFARQILEQEARRLGITFGAPHSQAQPGTATPGSAPPALTAAIRGRLSPELQWMAESLAEAQWAAHQMTAAPMQQREQERERTTRQSQYEELAAQLSEKAPGWEQHEDDMLDLLNFLQSPQMTHRRWGDKLSLLFHMATGNAAATAAAARQMGQAARQRTVTGQPGRSTVSNLADRVLKAKRGDDIQLAAQAAMEELQRQGIALPD